MKSKVVIQTGVRDGRTFLKDGYFNPPYKIANITAGRTRKCLELMVMSSSPGILDSDESNVEISLCENSILRLQTQSYQRLFPMKTGASQRMIVNMERNSSFTYLPHPVVPHEHSIFSAVNRIQITTGCQLVWGEILTCGRKHCDEVFRLHSYHNLTEIFFDNRLIIKENLLLKPSLKQPDALGQLEGYTHQATMIYYNANKLVESYIPGLLKLLAEEEDIESGVTALPQQGFIVRLLGNHAEQLRLCMKSLAEWMEKDSADVISETKIKEYAD